MAENLFGYSAEEALGRDVIELLTDSRDHARAEEILQRVVRGETWTGVFPVINKRGDVILIAAKNTPLYDDEGNLVGDICSSVDAKNFEEAKSLLSLQSDYENYPSSSRTRTASAEEQVAITSNISYLVSIVINGVYNYHLCCIW